MSDKGKPPAAAKADIRSFFAKPAGTKPAAEGAAGTAATSMPPPVAKAPPAAPPAAPAAAATQKSPKPHAKATPAKRAAAQEPEVVVVDDSDDEDAPKKAATKRPRATPAPAATPSSAKRSRQTATPSDSKPAKKVPKKAYPRPEMRPESGLQFTLSAVGNAWGGARPEPPPAERLDESELPRGPDDCLLGEVFVMTGTLPGLTRDDATNLVKRHGGRTTADVSSKTTYLVLGNDASSSKFRKAKENGTKLIDQEGLIALVRACVTDAPPKLAAAAAAGPSRAMPPAPSAGGSELWVDKYKPKMPADLIGNGKLGADLRKFLSTWHSVHSGPVVKGKDVPKKAVLLSGAPGIGKTSAAKIMCAIEGFDVMEVNASDARGKADSDVKGGMAGKLSNVVKEMVTNTAVNFDGTPKRQVLIMDEVDGMSAGDRGGIADLINTIKISKIPIICICNDAYSQKIKSLKNHCLEMPFIKPSKQQVRGRMMKIAEAEGLQVNEAAMEALIEQCRSDIRLVVNTLQMRRLNADSLQFDDVRAVGTKDLDLGAFDAVDRLMSAEKSISITDRMNLVYQDADIIPLFIQENYLNMRPNTARSDHHRMELLADAGADISDGDVLNSAVRRHQRWGLMPYAVMMSSVTPASKLRGRREVFGQYPGERNFNRFPSWLGKNSSTGKQRRLVGEVQAHTLVSGVCFANRSAMREEYMPTFRLALTAPMFGAAAGGREKEGIPQVMDLMNEYCLTRDDWEALLDITKIKAEGVADQRLKDPASLIPSVVKSAFTRACNDKTRDVKSGMMLPEFKKSRAKKKAAADADGDEEMEEDEDEEGGAADEEEEEADVDVKKMNLLAKRGINISLKGGAEIAGAAKKTKAAPKKAPAKPKAKK